MVLVVTDVIDGCEIADSDLESVRACQLKI